jgi:hypothetical protein
MRGGNTGVAANAEAFEGLQGQGEAPAQSTQPAHPATPPPTNNAVAKAFEPLSGLFEVGGTPATKVMDGGRRKRTQKKRGGRKAKSRSRSRSRHHRHRSRRGGSGGNSSLGFSEYN